MQEGDSYTLCYNHQKQETTLEFNSNLEVSTVSPGFAAVYLSVWLGERDPLDSKVRDALLGTVL